MKMVTTPFSEVSGGDGGIGTVFFKDIPVIPTHSIYKTQRHKHNESSMNHLIKKFGKQKRWVNYRLQKSGDRQTKIPYTVKGKKASSTNVADWTDFATASAVSKQVGIVFHDQLLLGIDIDHCLTGKKITHELAETIASLIIEADTYTEISPSGEGLHLFLSLKESLALSSNKKAPFEAYTSGRYFTFTGKVYGESKPVRTVTKKDALVLLSIIGYPWGDVSSTTESFVSSGKESTSILTDEEIVSKLRLSKKSEVSALYGGDTTGYKGDASTADMALVSYLAFWTRKDFKQIERIWLASPLGQREKTQKREDYRRRTINAAIKNCKNIYETPKTKIESANPTLKLLYTTTQKGELRVPMNVENIARVLTHEFPNTLRYDAFKNTYEIASTDSQWRIIEDADSIRLQTLISIKFTEHFSLVTKAMVMDAMIKIAKDNTIDSAKDYVESLKWDSTPRLDAWLHHTYGTPLDVYHKAVASNWLKGMVNRIINPGCKFDHVLVLEGEQGSKKSTSLAVLGKDWHVETTMSTDTKDFFMQFQGKAIIEFSEGETLNRTEVKRMKAIITTQRDKFRPPYERTSQDFPRRCVFAMTTNQEEYLKDETGNRRWLPVKVLLPEANVEWLEENREQLFAEAYHRLVLLKENTYDFPKEETLIQQALRKVKDPNDYKIREWYYKFVKEEDQFTNGITIDRVFKEAINGNMPGRSMMKHEQMNIGNVLMDMGLKKRDVVRNGIRGNYWFNETGELMQAEELTLTEKALKDW